VTVAVVTDSAADLPHALARSLGIRVVPLTVSFGDASFLDGVDLTAKAFWARLETDPAFPTTASPPPAAFLAAYREAAEAGAEAVVSVHLSGELSRTAESARAAATESPVPVEVVDSRGVSLGEGLVAVAAARAAALGMGLRDVSRVAARAPARTRMFAMLDTVESVGRGGRFATPNAPEQLRIRPVLTLVDGRPELVSRARTRSRAIAEVLARTAGPAEAAAVIHSGAPELGAVASAVREATGAEPVEAVIGAAMGAHMGPRALGVVVMEGEGPEGGE
jgi:DegV family protein with EDD domain